MANIIRPLQEIMPAEYRKNIRLKEYDYKTNGHYFITIVTHNKLPFLKPYKDVIDISIKNLPKFINGLSIDYFKIMDNHVHIIFIFKNCTRLLGRVVSAMKYSITKIVKAESLSHGNGEYNSPATIWQWNYYEHIIRNEKSLQKIREYIDNNPLAEIINWKDLEK